MYLAGIGIALLCGLIYAGSCWWYPLGHCWCCKGSGRHAREDGKVYRPCWWCKGTGRRWRIGRRIWNYFHRHVHT